MTKPNDTGSIYIITNNENGKKYVGQTWYDVEYRFNKHKKQKKCVKLARAMKKYGVDKFSVMSVDNAKTQEELDLLERFYIEKFNTVKFGYNCTNGGLGGKLQPESIEKIRAAHLGKKLSEETKKKISINNKAGNLDVRRKMSQSSLKKTDKTTITNIKNMLRDGMTQQRVADSLGISQSYVSRIINGNRRSL
jgi:group I intron endonuclease